MMEHKISLSYDTYSSGVSTELFSLIYCSCLLSFHDRIFSHIWDTFVRNCSVYNISDPSVENNNGLKNQ